MVAADVPFVRPLDFDRAVVGVLRGGQGDVVVAVQFFDHELVAGPRRLGELLEIAVVVVKRDGVDRFRFGVFVLACGCRAGNTCNHQAPDEGDCQQCGEYPFHSVLKFG
nr:hypothetical protein [Natrinema altunense]